MLEQPIRIGRAGGEGAAGPLALRDIVDHDKDTRPVLAVAGQDDAPKLDIEPFIPERVVHRMAKKALGAVPELYKLLNMPGQHIIPENTGKVVDECLLIRRLEKLQGSAIDGDHPDRRRAGYYPCRIAPQIGAQIAHTLGAPGLE